MSPRRERLRIALSVAAILASCVGCSRSSAATTGKPAPFAEACARASIARSDCDAWARTLLPEALPPSRGNRYADDEKAADLGFNLFFDPRGLSAPRANISCARCHEPERGFSDRESLSIGLRRTQRNALAIVNAARNEPHFWDGRADSLWSQPLITIENEDEMNGTRTGVAHFVSESYRAQYEAVFGPMPDLSDAARFPAQAKPGQAAWQAMTPADRDTVNRIYVNVGKSLEAYVRKAAAGKSLVDRVLEGKAEASPRLWQGMKVFAESGCFKCHGGPTFSDGRFHALDLPVPSHLAATADDPGRANGIPQLLASDFNALSRYYDKRANEAPTLPHADSAKAEAMKGAFLTPSLRSVGETAPYGHNGALRTLDEAVRFHLAGGGPARRDPLLVRRDLPDDDVRALVEMLGALHGAAAPLPWSFWPKKAKAASFPGSPDAGAGPDGGAY